MAIGVDSMSYTVRTNFSSLALFFARVILYRGKAPKSLDGFVVVGTSCPRPGGPGAGHSQAVMARRPPGNAESGNIQVSIA